jgi:hypothetical protein
MQYLAWIAFTAMSVVALWYKVRAERAEEWVYFIQSEIERLIEEDQESEA